MAKSRSTFQREVDDIITQKFNNQLPVRQFLLSKIADLTQHLTLTYGGDVRMFIKGGSALNILKEYKAQEFGKGTNENKDIWSDFDNQIIINPNLPVKEWFKVLFDIHTYFREEYLPVFQKEWDLFLTSNRRELSAYQRDGLARFHGQHISTDIFDHPRYLFNMENDDEKVKTGVPLEKCPVGNGWKELNFTLQKPIQSNMVFSAGMELMHPLNHFDGTNLLPELDKETLTRLKASNIHADELFFNQCFPPTVSALDDTITSNEAPDSSSILINAGISKFLLYRIIVRYTSKHYFKDGTVRSLVENDQALDNTQKAFERDLRAKFRGELLDISIPRRDSEETIQQWQQVKTHSVHYFPIDWDTNLKAKDAANKDRENGSYVQGILDQKRPGFWLNVPGWEYQLEENILLILEVIKGMSGSPHKFWKRATRAKSAVAQIYASAKEKFQDQWDKYLLTSLHYKATRTAFTKLANTHAEILRPLVQDIDHTLFNDYDFHLLDNTGAQGEKQVGDLFGVDLSQSLGDMWKELEAKHPIPGDNHSTYTSILNDKVGQQDEQNLKQHQLLLGFMTIYKKLHDELGQNFAFKDKLNQNKNTIYQLNQCRASIEENIAQSCSFCGIVSSFIDNQTRGEKQQPLTYHYPFFELFVIPDKVVSPADFEQQIKGATGVIKCEKVTLPTPLEHLEKTYFKLTIKDFKLPVLLWFTNIEHSQKKLPEERLIDDYKAQLENFEYISRMIKDKLHEKANLQSQLNSVNYTLSKMRRTELERNVRELEGALLALREQQRSSRRTSQMFQVFNRFSTEVKGRRKSDSFRILKPAEAIKHMDTKIAKSKSFYLTHWLDDIRQTYKQRLSRL